MDKKTKAWKIRLLALVLLLGAGEILFLRPHHPMFWWQKVPAFHLFLGLAGGFILILLAKRIGGWLAREEDYYG